jgi:hypothetical protein
MFHGIPWGLSTCLGIPSILLEAASIQVSGNASQRTATGVSTLAIAAVAAVVRGESTSVKALRNKSPSGRPLMHACTPRPVNAGLTFPVLLIRALQAGEERRQHLAELERRTAALRDAEDEARDLGLQLQVCMYVYVGGGGEGVEAGHGKG